METAPLQQFKITGALRKQYQAAPGAPIQPGGSCWHCGTAIMLCVVIEHQETGERHHIGSTCAERVGLNPVQVKRMLADLYAAERFEMSADEQRRRAAEAAAREAEAVTKHGEHGTETRYASGCACASCLAVAPHGTYHRFEMGDCRCLDCIDAALNHARSDRYGFGRRYAIAEMFCLIDLATGEPANARMVEGTYGSVWRVTDAEDHAVAWINPSPKRRTTITKKGYTEAMVPYLVENCGHGTTAWRKRVHPMGSAVRDTYGELIRGNAA